MRALAVLVLIAFMAKALVPAGFMPSVSKETGKAGIEICYGGGSVQDVADFGHMPGHGQDGENNHPTCPYAPVVAQDMGGMASVFTAALPFETIPVFTAADLRFEKNSAKPWLSRGPPAFS